MEVFEHHVDSSLPEYFYTQDFMDMEVYSGNDFNHQQSSMYDITGYQEPNAAPYWWLGDSDINPSSSFNENSSRDLQNGYDNSQAQVLTQPESEEPQMPYLLDGDLVQMVRPPYSYSELITMAFLKSPKMILSFRQICIYVSKNFPFYQKEQTYWQIALGECLFLSDCFTRVGKDCSDPDTGDYWILNLHYEKMAENGKFQRELDHTSNVVEPLRSDSPAQYSESKVDSSPALDTSSSLDDMLMSDQASTQLMENFSPSELWTYPTDYHHNPSLPGISSTQANLPQALAFPNQSSFPYPPYAL